MKRLSSNVYKYIKKTLLTQPVFSKKEKVIIYLTILITFIGFGIIIPESLSFMGKELEDKLDNFWQFLELMFLLCLYLNVAFIFFYYMFTFVFYLLEKIGFRIK